MNRTVDWQGVISTRSGIRLDLRNPTPEMINRNDIAAGLSRQCRWAGQTTEFYSVAQHSVLVSRFCRPENQLAGLLHDAPEAFIGDMARPIKDLCPDFREVESRLWGAIAKTFGVDPVLTDDVKWADDAILVTERQQLMPNAADWGWAEAPDPLPIEIEPWSPEHARSEWLLALSRLIRRAA